MFQTPAAQQLQEVLEVLGEDSSLCDDSFTKYVVFEIAAVSSLYVCLGANLIINKCKFSHMALVNTPTYPPSLRVKIICMLLMIGLLIVSAFLSFFDDSYWTKACDKPLFGLLYLIPVAVLTLAIDWTKYQFERKIPLLWYQNQLFWSLASTCYLLTFILCYALNMATSRFEGPDFVLLLLKMITSIFLTVYTFRRPQDISDYMGDSGLKTHLIQKQYRLEAQTITAQNPSKKSKDPFQKRKTSNNKLISDESEPMLNINVINKVQRRQNERTGALEIFYKLNIQTDMHDYTLLRSMSDFKQLQSSIRIGGEMTESASGMPYNDLEAILNDPESGSMSNVTFTVSTLQNFFNGLIKKKMLTKGLLSFLEVPEPDRTRLSNWSHQQDNNTEVGLEGMGISRDKITQFKNSDLEEHEEEEEKRDQPEFDRELELRENESLHITRASDKDYYPYFVVNIPKYKKSDNGSYIEFIINLTLSEKPDETWQVKKRYSDFVEIRNQLKNALDVEPPKLPKKLLRAEEEQLEERRQALESWMRIVLNEKLYFVTVLFQFIRLNPSYYEWLKEEETFNFNNFRATIDKNEILMNNNKPYTVYHITIEETSQIDNKTKKRMYTLYRRYKEFDQLNQALYTRFANSSGKLPTLPPKYTAFANKTTVDFRQQGLERYLNQLFQYPNIGDSFAFRKFINYKRTVDSFITGVDINEQILNLTCDPEPQNITNITIEKSLSTARSKKDL